MEPNSLTSEPQYQRPDQRNSDIDYIRRPEPIIIPAAAPQVVPVPAVMQLQPLLHQELNMVMILHLPEGFLQKWEENI